MSPLRKLFALTFLCTAATGCDTQRTPGTAPTDVITTEQPATTPPLDTANASKPGDEAERIAREAAIKVVSITPEELKQKIAGDKGKAVLVDFWATWCAPCRKEYPHTVELSNKHADDLVVYSVSMDETDDESVAGVKKALASFPKGKVHMLQSAQGGAEEAYTGFEITGGALPHYKVYDREGDVVATFGGDVDATVEPEEIDAAVAKAIGG